MTDRRAKNSKQKTKTNRPSFYPNDEIEATPILIRITPYLSFITFLGAILFLYSSGSIDTSMCIALIIFLVASIPVVKKIKSQIVKNRRKKNKIDSPREILSDLNKEEINTNTSVEQKSIQKRQEINKGKNNNKKPLKNTENKKGNPKYDSKDQVLPPLIKLNPELNEHERKNTDDTTNIENPKVTRIDKPKQTKANDTTNIENPKATRIDKPKQTKANDTTNIENPKATRIDKPKQTKANDTYNIENPKATKATKKISINKLVPKITDVTEVSDFEKDNAAIEEDFLESDQIFLQKHKEAKLLKPNEVTFKLPAEYKQDDFTTSINDKNATIGEVKAIVSDRLSTSKHKTVGPSRISLNYKGQKFDDNDQLFKDMKYRKGDAIEVSVMQKTVMVKTEKNRLIGIPIIDHNMTVSDLGDQIHLKGGFQLKFRNYFLRDEQKLNDLHIGEDEPIEIGKQNEPKKTVTFIFPEKVGKPNEIPLKYSPLKKLYEYKNELHLDKSTEYWFMTCEMKLFKNNNDTFRFSKSFPENPTVFVFNCHNKDDDQNYLNLSARCTKRPDRPILKVNSVVLRDVDSFEKDDIPITENQMTIKFDSKIKPKTIGELRIIAARKLGFVKDDEVSLVRLFILFNDGKTTDFALLDDDEEIAAVLSQNPDKFISFKILKEGDETKKILPSTLRNLRKSADELGLKMSDDELVKIYIRTGRHVSRTLSTLAYISCRK